MPVEPDVPYGKWMNPTHAPTRRLDCGRVRVHSSGAGAETYVLIHGIGVSSRYFRTLAAELARTATVHAIDLPGHGRSPKPPRPLDVGGYAAAVWTALDELGVERPVLVGHSMGAQIAVEMAASGRDPAALVLLGPTNYPAERGFWRQALRLAQDSLHEPLPVNAIVFSDYLFRCGPVWYLKTVPAMLDNHIEDGIGQVRVPVVVVRGERDPIAPAAWTSAIAHLAAFGSMEQLAGEQHVLMHGAPAAVADLCRRAVPRA